MFLYLWALNNDGHLHNDLVLVINCDTIVCGKQVMLVCEMLVLN